MPIEGQCKLNAMTNEIKTWKREQIFYRMKFHRKLQVTLVLYLANAAPCHVGCHAMLQESIEYPTRITWQSV